MVRRAALAAVAVAGALGAALPPLATPPAGASGSDNTAKIGALQSAIGEMSRQEATARATWQTVHDRRATLDGALHALDMRIAAASARADAAQQEAAKLAAGERKLEDAVRVTHGRLAIAQRHFEASAAALYTSSGATAIAYSTVSVDASSVDDVATVSVYLQHVAASRSRALDAIDSLRARIRRLQRVAMERRAVADLAHDAARREETQLQGLRAARAPQRAALTKQEARENAAVARIRTAKANDEAQLAALQQTSKQISYVIEDLQAGQARATNFHAARPVPDPIGDGYGNRFDPVLHEWRTHTGVDFEAGYGEPIHAAAPGTVIWAGPRGGYGNCVVIDHGGQFSTLYAHASAIYVDIGEHVTTGQTIAAVGATGWATGPHLHFEVRILGWPVDPMPYLDSVH